MKIFASEQISFKIRGSYFKASSGSIFAALRAGTRHATSTTAANTIATAMNVTVSIGSTPNSSDVI